MAGVDGVYNKRIIYDDGEGGVSILVPSTHCPSLDRLAQDVPAGRAYQIIDVSEVPSDRTFRNAWEYTADASVEKTSADLSADDLAKYNMTENR